MVGSRRAAAALALAPGAPTAALAEVGSLEFNTPNGVQTVGKKLNDADLILVRGFVIGGFPLRHEVVFRSNQNDVLIHGSWVSGADGDDLRLVGFNYDLFVDGGPLVASDAFAGSSPATPCRP